MPVADNQYSGDPIERLKSCRKTKRLDITSNEDYEARSMTQTDDTSSSNDDDESIMTQNWDDDI